MAFSRSVFTVLLICVVCKASNVPVFLWGDLTAPNLKFNPLTTTTSPAFSEILSKQLSEDPFTVVFIEKTLSVEDFSRKNDDGETSYPYLQGNIRKSLYLPSVENAIDALELLEDPEKVSFLLMEDGLSPEIEDNTGKFAFINLEDAKDGESRVDMLYRHNKFMKDIVSKLQMQHKRVVAVYTARQPSWAITHSRLRRQAENSNNTDDYILDGLRLYANNIMLVDDTKIISLEGLTSSTSDINSTAYTLNTTLQFNENSIVLSFRGAGGYWFFDTVTLSPGTDNEELLYPTTDVYALYDFSYSCGQNVTFVHGNGTKYLYFEGLQVQPVFHSTNESNPVVFGESFSCVGFFSAPIWSGLFVVFILLFITFYGILMMMDIRTMDRFDDPKGKTITINAGE